MSDLINRQDALDAVMFEVRYSDKIARIKNLPAAKPEWIPVSERLPETPDEVLTTYIVNGNRKKRFVETATYYDGDEGFWSSPWDEYRVAGTRVEVIAWMPMPLPYEVEK